MYYYLFPSFTRAICYIFTLCYPDICEINPLVTSLFSGRERTLLETDLHLNKTSGKAQKLASKFCILTFLIFEPNIILWRAPSGHQDGSNLWFQKLLAWHICTHELDVRYPIRKGLVVFLIVAKNLRQAQTISTDLIL